MNINEAIKTTRKKQKESLKSYSKNLLFILLFGLTVPALGGYVASLIFHKGEAGAFVVVAYYPFIHMTFIINLCRMSEMEIEYEKFYKEVFINAAIQNIDPLFTYNPTAGIDHEVIDKNKIYSRKKLVGEDKIEGTYNNVKFSFSEVKKLDGSGFTSPLDR